MAALRELPSSDATARAAVIAWLQRMRVSAFLNWLVLEEIGVEEIGVEIGVG